MIVTCPACSARYKILEAKIPGRGAKITCPRCSHRFVFYRDDAAGDGEKSTPDNVGALDFSEHGVTWKVRKGNGKPSYEFRDLNTLREYIQDGQVAQWDQISPDEREWTSIDAIPNLDAFFWSYWQRLKSGEVSVDARGGEEGSEEDDSDAPTTIVGRGSSLASEIRQAVQDAATPRPVGPRSEEERGEIVDEADPVRGDGDGDGVGEAVGNDDGDDGGDDDGVPAKTDTPSPERRIRPEERGQAPAPAEEDPAPPDVRSGAVGSGAVGSGAVGSGAVARPAAPAVPPSPVPAAAPKPPPAAPPPPSSASAGSSAVSSPAPAGGGVPVAALVGGAVVVVVVIGVALYAAGVVG